jgi:hypothetical protein
MLRVCNDFRTILLIFLVATSAMKFPSKIIAQPPATPPAAVSATEQFHAIAGKPFGVASLTIPIGVVEKGQLPRIVVSNRESRVFYPAVSLEELVPPGATPTPNPRPILKGGLVDRLRHAMDNASQQVHAPSQLRIEFLFRGDEPFTVELHGDVQETLVITPKPYVVDSHRSLLENWWSGYTKQSEQQFAAGDYPPGIEAYLTAMLSSRLSLPEVDIRPKKERDSKKAYDPQTSLELLAGTSRMRSNLLYSSLQRASLSDSSERVAVPSAPNWHDVSSESQAPAELIESIAMRVPPECFYIRFGGFSNALWFQDLTKGKGDGINQMIMMRGLDTQANQRLERMLNTKTTFIAKLFGDSLIKDMAIIGTDFYLQEGPAMGIIFEASNPGLMIQALNLERQTLAKQKADQGVRLQNVNLEGTEVSFLAAPDNSIRSFMVTDGNYLFITSSQTLAERFIQVGRGQPSLGQHPIFKHMRLAMPTSNNYSVFAFFSPEFFRNLLSPQYQIEMRRRLSAIARIQLADMASLSAASEGQTGKSLQNLVDDKFLPPWFLETKDDSQPIRDGERWIDSRRGSRGSMLPIPDVPVVDCSQAEAANYADLAKFYSQSWPQTEPLVIGVRRFSDPDREDVEQVALEGYVAPFAQEKYGWLSLFLAPPISTQIQMAKDDMISVQAHLSGKNLIGRNVTPDHVVFLGVKDMLPPPPDDSRKLLETLRMLQQMPAYLGAWPLPGYLDRLPFGVGGGPPDAFGFSKLLIGAWRWQAGGFSVLSFDRAILENCMLHLRPIPAEDPAQVRGQVGDLENSQLAGWVNTFWFRRALHASRGNALLMDTIQSQFHVPVEQSKSIAERLFDGRLQCSLGGEYQLAADPVYWVSTAWGSVDLNGTGNTQKKQAEGELPIMGLITNPHKAFPPPDYRAPWLGWIRGVQVHLTQLPRNLVLIAKLRLQKLPTPPERPDEGVSPLPTLNFDLFTNPFRFFGKEAESKPEADAPNLPPKSERREF